MSFRLLNEWGGKYTFLFPWVMVIVFVVTTHARGGTFVQPGTQSIITTACILGQMYDPLGDSKETDPRDDGSDPQGECPCPPKDCGDQSGGPGLHVKYANGNVWTELHILRAYGANDESLELSLYYNSLLVTPEVTDPNISLPLDRGMGLGWSHSLDLWYYELYAGHWDRECEPPPAPPDPPLCGPWEWIWDATPRVVLIDGDGRRNAYYGLTDLATNGGELPPIFNYGPLTPPAGRDGQLARLTGTEPDAETGEKLRLTHLDGKKTYYGANRRVSRIVTTRGLTSRFEYGAEGGKLSAVTDGYGRQIFFYYDSGPNGKLRDIIHPDSTAQNPVHTQLNYDVNGRLWKITDPLGDPDPEGHTVQYAYDAGGRMIEERLENGTTYRCSYEPITDLSGHQGQSFAGRTLTALKPDQSEEVILKVAAGTFPSRRDIRLWPNVGDHTTLMYVEDGRGHVADYVRDKWGMIIRRNDAPYQFNLCVNEAPSLSPCVTIVPNFEFEYRRAHSTINELGLQQKYHWETTDPAARGRIREIEYLGNDITPFSVIYDYLDSRFRGLPTRITQPNGGQWEYSYNDRGDVTLIKDPIREAPVDKVTGVQYTYYGDREGIDPAFMPGTPFSGRLEQVILTDRNGHRVTWGYDPQGNLAVKLTQVDGTTDIWHEFDHDFMGRRTLETLHRLDGTSTVTKYEYDKLGRLTKTVENLTGSDENVHGPDLDQNLVTGYEYDGHGLLTKITNPKGIVEEYKYDYRNRIYERHEDLNGFDHVTHYAYWGDDRIKTVTDAHVPPRVTSFDYSIEAAQGGVYDVTWITDALGYQTKIRHNGRRQVRQVERMRDLCNPPCQTLTFTSVLTATYDQLARLRTLVRGNQLATEYKYDWPTSCNCGLGTSIPRQVSRFASGSISGNVASVTFNEVDPVGRLTKRIQKVGPLASMSAPSPDADDAVTQYVYDSEGNLTDVHGPEGEHVEYGYDFADRLISRRILVGSMPSDQDMLTSLTLNDSGLVTAAVLPNGHTVEMQYDGVDRLRRQFDSLGDLATMAHDLNGNVVSRADGLNHAWTYHYDSKDRLEKIYDPVVETPVDGFTQYFYDEVDNLVATRNNNDVFTCYKHDALDRLTKVVEDCVTGAPGGDGKKPLDGSAEEGTQAEDPLGGGNPLASTSTQDTTTEYVWDGRFLVGLKDQNFQQTTFFRDDLGRTWTINYPGGGTVSFDHAPEPTTGAYQVKRTDQRGVQTTYKYDQLGQLKQRDYLGGGFLARSERLGIDRSGRLINATREVPGSTTAEFDWSRTLDPLGRPTFELPFFGDRQTGTGYSMTFSHELNAATQSYTQSLCYPGGSCPGDVRETRRTFDRRGRLVLVESGVNFAGRSTSPVDPIPIGDPWPGGADAGAQWSFDAADRRIGVVRPNATGDVMGYDANDRLTSLVSSVDVGGPELGHLQSFEYGYDPAGNRTFVHKMLQSDRSEHYGYDNRDRLTGMDRGGLLADRSGVATPINSPLLDSNQQWTDLDRRGNWKDYRWTDSPSGTPALHQRTSTVSGVNAYTGIDPDGAATGQPCTAGCLPSVTLTYDAAGNLTLNPLARVVGDAPVTNAGQWYKYDEENRVVEIRKTSSTGPLLLQFTYDALGRRVQTTEYIDPQSGTSWDGLSGHPSPRITRHIYAGLEPIHEYTCGGPGAPACDGSYTLAREFVWGDGNRYPEPIAMVDYTGANGVSGCDTGTPPVGCAYHFLRDALGSVTGLTDATGTLVERYTYDPYGKVLIERFDETANGGAGAWVATNASSLGNPFTWTGHRYDAAVGLYHTLFRHYSPQLGRWLQRDPIGYAGGSVNLYEYVLGNPLYWVDPLGLEDCDPFKEVDNLERKGLAGGSGAIRKNVDELKQQGAEAVLEATGGEGHVPVADPGPAQDAVLATAETIVIAEAVVTGAGAAVAVGKGAVKGVGAAVKAVTKKEAGAVAREGGAVAKGLAEGAGAGQACAKAGAKKVAAAPPVPPGKCKKTRTTKTGTPRTDSRKYWKGQLERDDISEANRQLIRNNRSPVVDDDWIKAHPDHAQYRGQKIELHHENYGPNLKEMPFTPHRGAGNYNKNHPPVP